MYLIRKRTLFYNLKIIRMLHLRDVLSQVDIDQQSSWRSHAFLVVGSQTQSEQLRTFFSSKSSGTASIIPLPRDPKRDDDDDSVTVSRIRLLIDALSRSSQSEMRIVIIDHAHQLQAPSANALLKILEEPPRGVIFFLCAPSAHHVLPTVRSRCQFVRNSVDDIDYSQRLTLQKSVEDLFKCSIARRLANRSECDDAALLAHADVLRSTLRKQQHVCSPTSLFLWYDALMALSRTPLSQRNTSLLTTLLVSLPIVER